MANLNTKYLDYNGLEIFLNKLKQYISDADTLLNNKIQALSLGMKLTVSVNPSVVHKNTGYQPEISGTLTNPSSAVIDSMKLKDGNTEYAMTLSSTANKYTYKFPSNISFTANKTYTVTAKALGMDFVGSTTIYARYPVYYGMGTSASDVKSKGTKASARTTAISSTTYDAKAVSNGVRFYLLVPNDVTRPSSFTMGGAPVDMTYEDVTLDGVIYRAYYTVATYNVGGEVKIKAQ